MKVNIVMLAHNRQKLTQQALETLYRNTPMELFNLTLIDDSSVQSVSASYDNATTLRIVKSRGITGQARNLGVYWAEKYWGRGEYLYLSDNDMYFTPFWLEKLIAGIGSCTLLGGWNHPFLQPKPELPTLRAGVSTIQFHDAVTGASQLMRWSTWDYCGPLDAHAKGVGQSEDWKFCQDILHTKGGAVGSVYPRVVFNCGVTNSYGEPSPGVDKMTAELVEAKRQYPDLYWE